MPKRDFGISLLCASRPLIEFVLRGRAETIRNISLRPQCRVTEIVPAETHDARRVSGLISGRDALRRSRRIWWSILPGAAR